MKQPVWYVIFAKELKDALRDRRALAGLLIFPVLGPVVIYFLLNSILDISRDVQDITLPVAGAANAPDLVDYLHQNGIRTEALSLAEGGGAQEREDVEDAEGSQRVDFGPGISARVRELIETRQHDYVLLIPDDFAERTGASRSINLEIHHDSSRTNVQAQVSRVQQVLNGWGRETAVLRLVLRGIDPQIITPVQVHTIDVATPQARAQAILGMIPMFVILAAFVSGMGVAVDQTAGERERKSLEPLLVNPISRVSIVFGKWMTAVLFSAVGLLLVMSLNLLALSRVPLEQMGLTFNMGSYEIIGIIVTTVPLAFFGTSIQIFVGIFARSFKDAQAYLSLITMLPMAPYFYNIFNSEGRELWMSFVPMLGQNMLLSDVVSGRTPPFLDFVLAAITVLLWSAVFLYLAVWVFRRERIIF